MFERIFNFLKKHHVAILLILIISTGIFLRAYKFNEFQRFNSDQSRDVNIVSQMMKDNNFLIMGPKADMTAFTLGPGYYYVEYIAVVIFGNNPATYAYPILVFSILTIPLLFVTLKKFFSENISLALTAVYSVSFFAIEYSRFAWNPNLLPFFVLAFVWLLLKLIENKEKKPKIIWPILIGVVVGFGVQFHTITMLLFVSILVAFFVFFLLKKYPLIKSLIFVIVTIVIINFPQLIHEFKTNGGNTKAFINVGKVKTNSSVSLLQRVTKNIECHTQANSYILSSLNDYSDCTLFHKPKKNPLFYYFDLAISLTFFIGGVALLFYYLKKKRDLEKKAPLLLILFYIAFTFLIFLSFNFNVDTRYFIVVFFLPFLLLGFWMKFLMEHHRITGTFFSCLLLVFLFVSNFISVKNTYFSDTNPDSLKEGKFVGMTINNAYAISQFILGTADRFQTDNIYVSASENKYYKTANNIINHKQNIRVSKKGPDGKTPSGSIVVAIKEDYNENYAYDNSVYTMLDSTRINTYAIFVLRKN